MSNKKKQNRTKKNCIYENSTTNGKVQLWAGNGENIILVAMPTEQIDKLSSVCVCVCESNENTCPGFQKLWKYNTIEFAGSTRVGFISYMHVQAPNRCVYQHPSQ